MMGAAVDAFDDGIGGSLELVVQPALDEPAEHLIGAAVAMKSETGDVRLAAGAGHRPVHRLDDVAADPEVAQRLLEARLQRPRGRADLLGEAQPFELLRAAEHQPARFRILVGGAGAQIGDAAVLIRDVAQGPVEAGPALGVDLLLQGGADLLLAARAELQGDALGGAIAEAAADVVAADHEVLPVIGLAADQDMDVRIVGVPVIDRDPVEPRAEIALDIGHQLAREGPEVGHLRRVLGRDDEPEMVSVILAPLGEGALVGRIGPGVEHAGVRAVPGDALALQIGDVLGKRRRTEARAVMAHDARLHDDAPRGRATATARGRRAGRVRSASGPCRPSLLPEALADMAGLLRGPHHLADEGLRALGAAVAVRMRPGRTRKSSSRRSWHGGRLGDGGDGARSVEIVEISG